jgi:hypothetical protein
MTGPKGAPATAPFFLNFPRTRRRANSSRSHHEIRDLGPSTSRVELVAASVPAGGLREGTLRSGMSNHHFVRRLDSESFSRTPSPCSPSSSRNTTPACCKARRHAITVFILGFEPPHSNLQQSRGMSRNASPSPLVSSRRGRERRLAERVLACPRE